MKSRSDAILHATQATYLDSILPPRDGLLAEVEHFAAENGHPIADPEVARLLEVLIRSRQPKRLFEVGTNIGYSVIVMGRAMNPDAVIETVEIDRAILDTARNFVARAALPCEVLFHEGAALDVLKRVDGPFDFAFIDCVKSEYEAYLDLLLPRMNSGGLIAADNVLWKGQVASGVHDASTDALRRFNERIMSEPRLVSAVLPIGDGVSLSVVR
jgi:predicted O-methyltransferase YrrM